MSEQEWEVLPDGSAAALMRSESFEKMMAELETAAIESVVSAAPGDHETRLHQAMRVQVIREIRDTLSAMAEGRKKQPRPGRA